MLEDHVELRAEERGHARQHEHVLSLHNRPARGLLALRGGVNRHAAQPHARWQHRHLRLLGRELVHAIRVANHGLHRLRTLDRLAERKRERAQRHVVVRRAHAPRRDDEIVRGRLSADFALDVVEVVGENCDALHVDASSAELADRIRRVRVRHLPLEQLVADHDEAGRPRVLSRGFGPCGARRGWLTCHGARTGHLRVGGHARRGRLARLRLGLPLHPPGALERVVLERMRGPEAARPVLQRRVGAGVVQCAEGGVALVVQPAVRQLEGAQEAPHEPVVPGQNRVDPHEGRHPVARRREGRLPLAVRVPDTRAEHKGEGWRIGLGAVGVHALHVIGEAVQDALLVPEEVRVHALHCLVHELFNLRELARVVEVDELRLGSHNVRHAARAVAHRARARLAVRSDSCAQEVHDDNCIFAAVERAIHAVRPVQAQRIAEHSERLAHGTTELWVTARLQAPVELERLAEGRCALSIALGRYAV
mmetsp:Transcript_25066/g.64742  ORF Transcript_25066/g.64742 Transcript_25066/m.64742 type:complete len:480 (+) Transcript_25066:338-1777(+)